MSGTNDRKNRFQFCFFFFKFILPPHAEWQSKLKLKRTRVRWRQSHRDATENKRALRVDFENETTINYFIIFFSIFLITSIQRPICQSLYRLSFSPLRGSIQNRCVYIHEMWSAGFYIVYRIHHKRKYAIRISIHETKYIYIYIYNNLTQKWHLKTNGTKYMIRICRRSSMWHCNASMSYTRDIISNIHHEYNSVRFNLTIKMEYSELFTEKGRERRGWGRGPRQRNK